MDGFSTLNSAAYFCRKKSDQLPGCPPCARATAQVEHHDADAIIKVLAKLVLLDGRLQIAVRAAMTRTSTGMVSLAAEPFAGFFPAARASI